MAGRANCSTWLEDVSTREYLFWPMKSDPNIRPQVVRRATFSPLVRPYLVLVVAAGMAGTIVLLPLTVLWFLGIGQWWARHYYDKLECELTSRFVRFRKGILFQVEKTIPLENIQDVTLIEGPVLRHFNLSVLKFETAGHTPGNANDMRLVGVNNAVAFRNEILQTRDRLKEGRSPEHPRVAETHIASLDSSNLEVLQRIEARLSEIVELLRVPR